MSEVTRILESINRTGPAAASELLPLVYAELRKLAAARMAAESPGQTLQPTALVHEAWLRLTGNEAVNWDGKAHFFGAAAEAMRRILIDNARRKQAARHGGGQQRLDLAELDVPAPENADELLVISEALEKFVLVDQRKAELVKLRYFAGLTMEETADVLGISLATAKRWWTYSRVWLFEHIRARERISAPSA